MEGQFNGGFFALPVWGAYIWRGLFSEFYGIICEWLYFAYEFLDYSSTDITYSSSDETVTFGFSSPLPKGRGLLSMDFTGQLNDKLKGFYRSKYTGEDGSEKFCAATHFEVL